MAFWLESFPKFRVDAKSPVPSHYGGSKTERTREEVSTQHRRTFASLHGPSMGKGCRHRGQTARWNWCELMHQEKRSKALTYLLRSVLLVCGCWGAVDSGSIRCSWVTPFHVNKNDSFTYSNNESLITQISRRRASGFPSWLWHFKVLELFTGTALCYTCFFRVYCIHPFASLRLVYCPLGWHTRWIQVSQHIHAKAHRVV